MTKIVYVCESCEEGDAEEQGNHLAGLAKAEIERLRAVIQSMHRHYNPGAEPFDIEAAISALPQ